MFYVLLFYHSLKRANTPIKASVIR